MKKNTLLYSQFIRELTFKALWIDFSLLITALILLIYTMFTFQNPIKLLILLLIVRAFATNSISIHSIEKHGGKSLLGDKSDNTTDIWILK